MALRDEKAIALRYSSEQDRAPLVTAKGSGRIAEKILEIAKDYGVPIHEDPDLVEVLSKLNTGDEIPYELYQAVAEVLVFVYRMNKELGETKVNGQDYGEGKGSKFEK